MSVISFQAYQECSWKEFSLAVSGAGVYRIRGISYDIDSEDEELFAQGDEAISIQSGNISKSGKIKVLKSVVDALQLASKAAGGRYVTDLTVTLTAVYQPSIGRPMMTDTLGGCKLGKMPKGWEQGAKFMEMEIPFKFLTLVTTP
jgi:hypothetical protein